MLASFTEFLIGIKEARFGFRAIWAAIVSLYTSVMSNPDMVEIWGVITGFYHKHSLLCRWLLLLGCIVIAFFGKKILSVLKFGFFFILGFGLGIYFLMPIFPEAIHIPAWIVGIVVGIVAAVLYKFLYVGTAVTVVLYTVYALCYNGFYINGPAADFTAGKAFVSLFVAIVVVVLAIVMRKYAEMVGTAVLGGWLATFTFIRCIYDYNSAIPFLAERWWLGVFIPMAIISAVGIVIQVKTRKRW